MKNEMQFNPEKHIAAAEVENIFSPESFISLGAVVDKEKAHILAEEIHKNLQLLFEELATAEVMFQEESDEESRKQTDTSKRNR